LKASIMKWSWKIARVAGIDVYIHTTFLILIAWIALAYWQLAGTLLAVVSGVSFILALFFCVLLHEFGHALTALDRKNTRRPQGGNHHCAGGPGGQFCNRTAIVAAAHGQ